jgi:sugar lactone lactonase YvrE
MAQTNIPIWFGIAGNPSLFGSADGANASARFYLPTALAADTNANVFIADTRNQSVRQIRPSGTNWVSSTLGIVGTYPYGIAADNRSNIFVTANFNSTVTQFTPLGAGWTNFVIAGSTGLTGTNDDTNAAIRFNNPLGIGLDPAGNLYVADSLSETVRKLTRAGTNWISSTIAGLAGISGTTDGTNSIARFYYPNGLAVDANTNIFVTDSVRYTVRRIFPTGTNWVTITIAGLSGTQGTNDGTNNSIRFTYPSGITVDAAGIVYVADEGNSTIRKLTPSGTNWISKTIGGLGIGGSFNQPRGIASDNRGLLYVANSSANTIWIGAPPFGNIRATATNGIATVNWTAFSGLGYQVQYRTNILSTNWINLGTAVNPTNAAASVTDTIGTNKQRFYRVVWVL